MFHSKKLFALILILPITGCTITKRAIKEVQGARSKIMVVPGTVPSDLSQYRSIEVTQAKNDLGGLVSPAFVKALPRAIRDAATTGRSPVFTGGQPVLLVEPQIQWYSEVSGFKELMGSPSFAVALLVLRDGDTEVGRVQIVTKNASSRDDEVDMAESMGQKFAEWVADWRIRFPVDTPGAAQKTVVLSKNQPKS